MTTCQRVGRWQTQNMISFPKEIMTRGLVPESLVRKSEPWMIHYFLKNTSPNPQLIHLHLYFCTCHQNIIFCVFVFNEFKFYWICSACLSIFLLKMIKMKLLEMKLILIFVIITWWWVRGCLNNDKSWYQRRNYDTDWYYLSFLVVWDEKQSRKWGRYD